MFYIDDWRPITEVHIAFILAANRRPDADDEEEATEEELAEDHRPRTLQEVLRGLSQIGVLLPTGALVKGTGALLSGLSGLRTKHVDLLVGTVGSGIIRDELSEDDPFLQKFELERRYGIFLGCPVMINEAELNEAIRVHFPWHTTGVEISPELEAEIAEAVVILDPPRRTRGRPKHGDGLIERMVHKHFGPKLAPGGDWYGEKKDWVEDRAIEWVKAQTCDLQVVSKTVMGGYLKPLYPPEDGGK